MSETESNDAANSARARQLAGLKPFAKGVSGNPRGRPKKVRSIEDIAVENGEKAMRILAKLLDSDDEKVALAAANALLDRGVGKPKQAVTMDASVKHDHGSKPVSETAEWVAGVLGSRQDRASTEPVSH
ncbi:MAG: hypothetical protein K2X00_10910 [Nitrospiraceae bacterium]|nr:hypothetical protein [Nitrospiraceae bacterium]